jgi:hypothetical protein
MVMVMVDVNYVRVHIPTELEGPELVDVETRCAREHAIRRRMEI